ncbi:winged helix-turn-helix domain-containing protein [Trabulsiella odontotermitis]|uniref:winged helix-turn-helix domain-containing protein n=1 Tax=Trabulsiella odontotermitis TaxID=379893 RepID=UPI001EE6B3B9|nr:winged helix-turn-helix domain-containing protein [Trabulsiella odontotermitis]
MQIEFLSDIYLVLLRKLYVEKGNAVWYGGDMRFDIEGFITFDTEDASLVNVLTGDCIELSQTSTRLLAELLDHHGDLLSRNEIFQSVFDKYGARASNSNLNQYISTLRRNLCDLGVEKEIIVTVPRIGFKISEEAIINNDREYRTPCLEEKQAEAPAQYPITRYRPLFTKALIVAFVSMLLLINVEFSRVDNSTQKVVQDKCRIFMPSALSLQDVTDSFNLASQPLDCSSIKDVYVYRQQIKSTIGNYMQLLIVECKREKSNCVSFYVREQRNV